MNLRRNLTTNVLRIISLLFLCLTVSCENTDDTSDDSRDIINTPSTSSASTASDVNETNSPTTYTGPSGYSHDIEGKMVVVVMHGDLNEPLQGASVTFYSRTHLQTEFNYLNPASSDANGCAESDKVHDCLVASDAEYMAIKAVANLTGFISLSAEAWFVDSGTITKHIYLFPQQSAKTD